MKSTSRLPISFTWLIVLIVILIVIAAIAVLPKIALLKLAKRVYLAFHIQNYSMRKGSEEK